jgi:hypothetical protein
MNVKRIELLGIIFASVTLVTKGSLNAVTPNSPFKRAANRDQSTPPVSGTNQGSLPHNIVAARLTAQGLVQENENRQK